MQKPRRNRVQKSQVAEDSKTDLSVKDKGKFVKKSLAKVAKPSTDSKLEKLDQKWSEWFSREKAIPLSKTFTQPKPVFQPVVVSPAKPPPAGAVDNSQPFFQPQLTDLPTTNQQLTNTLTTLQQQPAHWPKSDNRPSTTTTHQPPTNQPATLQQQPKTDN